ncbi:MAG: tetratricopeptide repeat protein, partial [Desulfosarcina sp.]|nr:tetratricopeptide repeat protein [Desulfobacterales bacterium]
GQLLLDQFTKAARKAEACQVYRDCSTADKAFKAEPAVLLKIGSWLNETREHQEAIGAYKRLIKTQPDSPLVPKAYFQAARVLHSGLQQTPQAQKIIQGLIRKFPDHDIVPFARDFMKQLKKTAG